MGESTEPRHAWMASGSLSLALLMTALDTSLTNTSLPALARAFGGSFADAQWIVLAYLLAVTSLTVAAGRLGDVLGRRRVFLAAIALFTSCSVVCATAPTLWWLVGARAVQGACAAAMMALALALVGDVPAARPERLMGRLAAMSAIGTTLGPAVGSAVSHLASGAIFLVNVPLGGVAFALAIHSLPPDTTRAARTPPFDAVGTLLLAATLLAYALSMTRGGGYWTSANVVLLAGAFAGLGAFVLSERRAESPLVPVAMFRNSAVSVSLVTSALVATVVSSTLLVGPFYLARGLGLGPAGTGIALSTGPAAAAVTATVAGRLVERVGAARAAIVGLTAMAFGGALVASLPFAGGVLGYVVPLVVLTSGYAVFQTANNAAALAGAHNHRGVVAGLLTLSRNLGQITGASAMGAVFLFASGASDVSAASPAAIAAGMRGTMAAATILVVLALVLALRRLTLVRSVLRDRGAEVMPPLRS